jgi:predicted metalloenzyme YecM
MIIQKVIGDYEAFLEEILGDIKKAGFDFSDFVQLDHICYRTNSIGNYDVKKKELSSTGTLVTETQISGRLIATFRLLEPIRYGSWRIDAIELPAPKPDNKYPEGLEHVEFVIFDNFETFLKKYNNHDFDLKSMNRGINPEIALNLGKYSVKFHLLGLLAVTYLEQKIGIQKVSS